MPRLDLDAPVFAPPSNLRLAAVRMAPRNAFGLLRMTSQDSDQLLRRGR